MATHPVPEMKPDADGSTQADLIKILIADDSLTQREMAAYALREEPYQLIFAADGIEAINQIYSELPDLVLLDVEMPKMSGYHVCRLLRDDPKTADIPVVMITTRDQQSDRFWGLQTGANLYMSKNFQPQELRATIVGMLEGVAPHTSPAQKSDGAGREVDVLSRLNALLDRRLYEATLVNEVNRLAVSADDFHATVAAVMSILAKIVDFGVGSTLLFEEKQMVLTLNQEVGGNFLEELQKSIFTGGLGPDSEPMDPQEVSIHLAGRHEPSADISDLPVTCVHTLTLRGKHKTIGLLSLTCEGSHFPEAALDLLEVLEGPISTVLDNARLYEETKRLAITDGLTKIYNRRFFQEAIEREYKVAVREKHPISVIMYDIDFFKKVNDTHGHQVGDSVLCAVTQRVKNALRDTDIIARYGGEEFAVVLPGTPLRVATMVAERVRSSVEHRPLAVKGLELPITISLGVGSHPESGVKNQADLLAQTDAALYRAKQAGRNRVATAQGAEDDS